MLLNTDIPIDQLGSSHFGSPHKVQQHAEAAIATSVSKYTHMQLTAQSRGAGYAMHG